MVTNSEFIQFHVIYSSSHCRRDGTLGGGYLEVGGEMGPGGGYLEVVGRLESSSSALGRSRGLAFCGLSSPDSLGKEPIDQKIFSHNLRLIIE